MRKVFVLAFFATIIGCSGSSGVVKIGPETFTISTAASPGRGGLPAAKKIAYDEANDQCRKSGNLELYTLSEKASSPTWTEGMANFELNFRCLSKNDPEFKRQNLISSPDQIMEHRNR